MPATSLSHTEKRIVLVLRLWTHEQDKPVWIGEIQDVFTGETVHVQNLEALFKWLKHRTASKTPASKEMTGLPENDLDAHSTKNDDR
jgi:hypothetical protein